MINKNIDCLILGCTHFNHVKDIIKEIVSDRVTIIDTIEPVNKQILSKLKSNNILNKSNIKRFIKIFYNGSKLSQNFHDKEYNLNYLKF